MAQVLRAAVMAADPAGLAHMQEPNRSLLKPEMVWQYEKGFKQSPEQVRPPTCPPPTPPPPIKCPCGYCTSVIQHQQCPNLSHHVKCMMQLYLYVALPTQQQ